MSLFDVVFNRHEKFSSDANVNTSHDDKTVIVGPVHQADVAQVEAETPEDAVAAVRVAYAASTSEVSAHEVQTPAESEPTDEAPASVESLDAPADKQPEADEVGNEQPANEQPAVTTEVPDSHVAEPEPTVEHVDAPVQVDAPE